MALSARFWDWMAAKSKVDFFEVLKASPSISRDQGHLVPILGFSGLEADFRGFALLLVHSIQKSVLQIHTV